jgi:hypothetical protein
VNVNITDQFWFTATELRAAASEAGDDGSVTMAASTVRALADQLDDVIAEDRLRDLASDLLKGVVLQGAARAAIPVEEDVRSLVRLARVLRSELDTPTAPPAPKPELEDEE